MRVQQNVPVSTVPSDDELSSLHGWAAGFSLDIRNALFRIARAINGSLTFGDGTQTDNIRGEWVTLTTDGTPGAENAITHSLGATPPGFLILKPPASGVINTGATAWTSTTIYVTCTAASQEVTLFILAPPESA
jgi:hypothetical protein